MNLTILGSGTASPHKFRASSGYWLETSAGTIALDMSAAAVHRAAQENLDWANLDVIWLSHFHLDHCGGIAPYLFGMKYAFETQSRTKPLRIFGAKGLRELLETFDSAGDYKIFEQPFPLEIREIAAGDEFEILPNIKAKTLAVPHIESSLAIRITDGASFVYTGDTGVCDDLGAFARDADLFLIECAFVDKSPTPIHIALPECFDILRSAQIKRAVLTHFYGEWDALDFQQTAARYSPPCEVIEAQDGLHLEII